MTTSQSFSRTHPTKRWWLLLLLIILAALVFRLAFVYIAPSPDNQIGDSVEFDLLARNLLAGHGLSYREPWTPSARKTPLYPWLLAQTYRHFGYGNYIPLLTLQAILDALLAALLAWLALLAWRDRRIGLVAAGLWAIYLPAAQLSGRLLADSLFGFLQMAGFALFIAAVRHLSRGNRALFYGLLSGLLFGLASLARPTAMYVPFLLIFVMAGWWLWRKKIARKMAFASSRLWMMLLTMLLAMVIVLTPWFVRNYRAFGQPVMGSTLVGFNFFFTNYRLDQPDYWKLHSVNESLNAIRQLAVAHGLNPDVINEAELFQLAMNQGLSMVRQYPGRFLILSGLRTLQLWFNLGFTLHPSAATLLFTSTNLGLLILACWSEIQAWRHRVFLLLPDDPLPWAIHLSALLILLFYTVSYALIIAYARYIIPIIPFLIILAAGAPWRWLLRRNEKLPTPDLSHLPSQNVIIG